MNPEFMKELGFHKEVARVAEGLCPFCNKPVKAQDFRDDLSREEFKISGLCQACQDDFFGKDET